ncbi:hypothetical protein GCM10010269_78880 [Streptomyces humidus]|uniref:PPM-type phosphatase domain-containing protein n=1 Tax=Streptomyces humidus TaxID=52259 RepID=A0A918LB83_9ACTN|nr:hypothetical protein GCM10010269_78880 [Streptomyces humidus]
MAGEEIARDNAVLERGLLPDLTLRGDGLATAFRYAPGRAHTLLGGDFCDVVRGDDGSAHVITGDVSGHGGAAAALGVHLSLAWRTAVLCGQSQLEQLHLLERILTEERAEEETYATVVSLANAPPRPRQPDARPSREPGDARSGTPAAAPSASRAPGRAVHQGCRRSCATE